MTTHFFRRWFVLALVIMLGSNNLPAARAQVSAPTLTLAWVDSQAFPTVTAYFNVSDATGLPVVGLTQHDFGVQEDGVPVPGEAVRVSSDTGQGLNLVLALDLSMDADSFAKLQAATKAFIDTLGQQDRAALVAYYNEAITVQDFTGDKTLLKAGVDSLAIRRNSTSFNAGALQAVNLAATLTTGRKAVVMLTDSGDNFGKVAASESISQARQAKVPIYTVGFGLKLKAADLRTMALQTGGQPFTVFGPGEVRDSLQTLSVVLRQGYTLTYRSTLKPDNAEHTLTLAVTYLDQKSEVESAFVATPSPVTVTTSSLAGGQSLTGQVRLTAQVEAPAAVASVVYWLDGQPLLASFTAPDFAFEWDTTTVAPGPHSLIIKAVDAAGNEGETEIDFVVALPDPLSMTATISLAEARVGQLVTVEAYPVTVGQVLRVDFWLDDELLGSDGTAPYSFILNTGAYKTGSHTITIRAEDDLKGVAEATLSLTLATVPGRNWLSYLLFAISLIVMIVLVVYAWGLMRNIVRAQASGFQKTCQVEINNQGNARSRYELKADDPIGALTFQFWLNGVNLAKPPEPPPAAEPTPAPRKGAPASGAQPAGGAGAKSGLKDAGNRAYASGSILADMLTTIGYLLPAALGSRLVSVGMSMRQAQTASDRVRDVGRSANQLKATASGQSPYATYPTPSSGASGPEAAPPSVAAPRGRETSSVSVGPITPVTPAVAPGETITLQLIVNPVGIPKTKEYIFRVITKALDMTGATDMIEQGTIKIARRPLYIRLLPWLAFIPLTLVVIWIGQFGLRLMGWL